MLSIGEIFKKDILSLIFKESLERITPSSLERMPDGVLIVFGGKMPTIAGIPVAKVRTIKALFGLLYPDEVNEQLKGLQDDLIVIQLPEREKILGMSEKDINDLIRRASRCAEDYHTGALVDVRPIDVRYFGKEMSVTKYWDDVVCSEV